MASPAEFISDARFHQTFETPVDATVLKVTYADYGYRNEAHPEEENVLLFFSPLMGSRLLHVAKDELAKKHKIRIINPDRPGMGGADAVDRDRMRICRETTTALLAHLNIAHVSVACHSGGTIYALDFVLHHPELLHPSGYIAIAAPWILPAHSSSTTLAIVQHFPTGLINQTDKMVRLINNYIGPAIGGTVGFSTGLVGKLMPSSMAKHKITSADVKFENDVQSAVIERIYNEDVQGVSADAVLFMQKDGPWSDWGDYDTLIPRLGEKLRAMGRTLRADVFYAEKDRLIGDGGSKAPIWFDKLWNDAGDGWLEYQSRVAAGTDHDSIWGLGWDVVQEVFERIGQ
ncbi:hypothetical protein QBC47DRAFT_279237, partial [Echria macrotheca]